MSKAIAGGENLSQIIDVENMRANRLFESKRTIAWKYLTQLEWVWEAIPHITEYIAELGAELDLDLFDKHPDNVWIHKTATVAPTAFIGSSVIIGANTQVRHCAFVRGSALIGENAVIGNSSELKNVILFDGVQVPHFNYIGDSVFGHKAHLGAGAVTCNTKNDHSLVTVRCGGQRFETGLKKLGSILGDFVEVGCNSTLNPGTVIGANTSVYPLSRVRGFVPKNCIFKEQGDIVERV